jgi:uncharacterized Fe-S cluster protein YjdI
MSDAKPPKTYTNGEVTIVWDAPKCIHSAKCVHGLPDVFKPRERPWISAEGADSEALLATIAKCPSGALTAYRTADGPPKAEAATEGSSVDVLADGPLMVKGPVRIKHPDGREEVREKAAALCRCGASANKPFCDGAHKGIDFKAS